MLWTTAETESKSLINGINFQPFDALSGFGKTKEELENEGAIFVESISRPEENGMISAHFINPQTKEQWYEYTDRPKTATELLNELDNTILELTTLISVGVM